MKKLFITFFAMGLLLALCGMAQAYSWNVETDFSFFNGTTNQYTLSDGTKITSTGGNLNYGFEHSYGTLGVSSMVPGNQININQSITFEFAQAQYVNSLSVSQFYIAGNYYDLVNEKAGFEVTYADGTTASFTLTTDTATTAIWSGSQGSVTNVSPGIEAAGDPYGGVWSLINNPFGDMGIVSITLTALDNGMPGDLDYNNSDFGFYAMETTPTPIPGAVWLLGTGLFGLVGLRRKFRG